MVWCGLVLLITDRLHMCLRSPTKKSREGVIVTAPNPLINLDTLLFNVAKQMCVAIP